MNPNIVNPNIVNPNIVNPNIVNPSIADADVTDIEWNVTNAGNTVSSYTFKIFARESLPKGIYAQLLVYKTHYAPATDGENCQLKETPHQELLLNIINPNIVNPNIVNPNIVNPNIVNSAIENATFFLSPGDEAKAVLRLIDPEPGVDKFLLSGRKFRIQSFAESLDAATSSQAVDSDDALQGDTTGEADSTDLIIITSSLPDGTVGESYPAIQLEAAGGDGTYVWSVNSELLPPGIGFTNDGIISGLPQEDPNASYPKIYSFLVHVTSGGDNDTQNLSITINSAEEPTPPLNIETTTLPPGTVGNYYGYTLQATGGIPPRNWSKTSGVLPLGLTLDSAGIISGTIVTDNNVSYPHNYTFTVQVMDANSDAAAQPLSIMVDDVVYPDLTISGTITDENGSAVQDVSIYGLPHAPRTDSYGFYTDTVPHGWSGTITPFKEGHTFQVSAQDPSPSRIYVEITSDQYSQDFISDTINYTISGTITFYGSPLAGVMMNGLPGPPVTNASGYYSASVPHGWSGTVTPELLDYIFEPPSRTYSSITSDYVNQFYTATFVGVGTDDPFEDNDNFGTATDLTAGTYTNMQLHDDDWYRVNVQQGQDLKIFVDGEHPNNIDVEISNSAGNRVIGAYGDPADETAYASNLSAGWHYIRVIYLGTSGFWNSYDLTITVGNNLGNGDITGNVSNSTPAPLVNVEVTAYDTQSDHYFATSTDANGDYKISLPPSLYKLYFDASALGPPNYVSEYYDNKLTFENADAKDVQDGMLIQGIDAVLELESVLSIVTTALPDGNLATPYSAQLEATGGQTPYTWNLADGSGPLPDGLILHSSGLIDGSPTTLGTFAFTVEVTDSTPTSVTQELSITIVPYAGTEYVISGTVSPALAGIAMSGFPGNPATNSLGEYTAIVYSGWSGTVTPVLAGYAFTPASRTYNNVSANISGENYTAATGYAISGQVTLDGSPLQGVLMSGLPGDPCTDGNGQYSTAVASGWSGTVTPTLPGFTFNPESIPYTNVTSDQPGQDYTANFQGGQDDIYEDNDDPSDAAEVTLGTHTNLVLADEDWFKVYIPAGNEDKDLKIHIKGHSFPDPNGGRDLDFAVLDESERMLGYVLSSSDDETLYITDVDEGYYYIGQYYIGQPETVYSLTVELSDNFGIGYISGRITDETSGQPIEGVYVELYGQPFDWGNSRPLITTDENGEYKVGYTPGDYTVRFNLQSLGSDPYAQELNYIGKTYNSNQVFSVVAGSMIEGIDAQLKPGGTITGRVTDPVGNGLNNGVAYAYSSDNTLVSYSWTDGNGNYRIERLPMGNYKVRARGGVYGSMWYDGKGSLDDGLPVPVRVGMTTPNIDLQLEESAIIEGRVTDSSQNPIQDVIVGVYDVSGISLISGRTNSDGYYWIGRRIPTGDVKIYFDAFSAQGNYASEYHTDKLLIEDADPVSVQSGQSTFIDAVLVEGGIISGRVTDAQDNAFPGVAVHCMDIDSDRYYAATTDADGNYLIGGLQPDSYKVRFRTGYGDYATQWFGGNSFAAGSVISVSAGAHLSGIDAQLLDNGGFISGRVTNTSGNGIQDVRVLAQDSTKEAAIAWTDTDADGYYTIPRIPTCNAKVYFFTDGRFLNYVSEWYNDMNSHASAGTVAVTFGQETSGINAVLAPIPPVNIATTSLPNGEVAVPYEITLEVSGGREFYHWSLISGSLPPGLMFNSKGEITGTPTASGTHNFTVRVTDSSRNQQLIDTQTLSLTVDTYAGSGYLISGAVEFDNTPLEGVVLQGLPGNPVTSTNGEYIVAVPQGWSGTVTPTHSSYYFDPQSREYTDVGSNISGQDYTAYELTLQITTEWLLNGTEGYPYSQSLTAEGGTGPYTWSLAPGSASLPYGLTLNNDGTITGTPTHPNNYDFTVRVTDSSSPIPQLIERDLSIFIHGDPTSEGPVLYWKLDENQGTVALDSSGYNDHGTLMGNVSYTSDAVSAYAVEILTNGWLERSYQGPFHFVNQAVIAARVKIDDFSIPDRFVWKLQYNHPFLPHPHTLEILLNINGSELDLVSGNGLIEGINNVPDYHVNVDLSNPLNGFDLGQYNQIIVMINGDTYTIYINGNQVASATGAPFEVHDSIQHFWVGGADWSDYWLGGKIDEIMVFNRILGTEDISLIYATSTFPTISGTVLFSDNSPFPWVRMNGLIGDPHVQEDGTYIGIVQPGWSGAVTPDMGGYYFAPPNRTYNNVTSDITNQNYTAYEGGSLWIETGSIPSGKKGEPYNTTLVAADGVPPYTWSIAGGSLPSGLTLNPNGDISGSPTEAGDFTFTVRVLDSDTPPRVAERDFYLFVSAEHQGFWTTTYPDGGNMHAEGLTIAPGTPDVIFATAENRGIFRSTNDAASWDNLIQDPGWPYGETDYPIFIVHRASGNYYICSGGRIYMSTDSGGAWEMIYEREDWDISTLTVDPTSPTASVIYVGTWEGEMFRTTDGGANWSAVGSGLPADNEITVITIHPVTPATLYAGTNNSGIYKSADGGANWIASNGTIDFSWVEDIKIDPTGNIYVMSWTHQHGGGLYHSSDGTNWLKILDANPGWSPGDSIAIDPNDADTIYVASNESVFKGTFDVTWTWNEYSVSTAHTEAIIIDPGSTQTLYAATGGEGVWKSSDGGANWAKTSDGIRAIGFVHDDPHSLEIDKSNPYPNDINYIYSGSQNGGYRSLDGGSTWEKMDHPSGSILALLTHPDAPGNVYSYHNSLDISTSNGSSGSWVTAPGFPGGFSRGDIGMAADDPGIIYVGTWGSDDPPTGVYKTTNGGTNFTPMNNGLTTNTEIQTLAVHPGVGAGDHDIVLIGLRRDWPLIQGKDYGLYKTTDGGDNWYKITSGLPDGFFARHIVFCPSNPDIMYMMGESDYECGVYKSTDQGENWWQTSGYCGNTIAVHPNNPDHLYMGSWDGFYVSLNGGTSWFAFNDGLPTSAHGQITIHSIALDPNDLNHVFIGTSAGVYEATFSFDFMITTEELPSGIVAEFYTTTLETTGGTSPVTWELTSGDLPAGLSLDSYGIISGTPPEVGYWEFTIKATDNGGNSYTRQYGLSIHNTYVLATGTNPEEVGSVSVDPLLPRYIEGTMVDVTVTVPQGYIFAGWSGDATGRATVVHVEMTRDKTLVANFALPGSLPDYDISSFNAPGSASAGDVIGGSVSAEVRNQGAADPYQGEISVGIYLSPNPEITTSDMLLWKGRTSIAALNGGAASVPIPADLQIPTTVSAGTYSIGILVDEFDVSAELNEDNNFASLAININSTAYDRLEFLGQWHGGESNAVACDEARNLAFVGHGALFQVLDVSDPSNPTKIGEVALGKRGISDIAISGTTAYVAGDAFWIVDVSTPTNPSEIGHSDIPNLARGVVVSGNYAYVTDHFHQGLRVFDITIPNSPNQLSFTPFPGRTRGIAIKGSYLYIQADVWLEEGETGIRIVNISNPSSPTQDNFYATEGFTGWPEVAGNYLFLPTGSEGLHILDISDPPNLPEAIVYSGLGNSGWIKVNGNHAYVNDNDRNSIVVLNIADVNNVYEEGAYHFENQTSVNYMDVLGNHCYADGWYHSLKILNMSNPSNPTEIGSYDEIEGMYNDVDASGDLAFITSQNEKGIHRFRSLNMSSLPNITGVGTFLNPANMYRVRISGDFAFVVTSDRELKVLDIADPSHPHEVAVYDNFDNIYDLEMSGDYAFVLDYYRGLQVIDVSSPANPVFVSQLYIHPATHRLAISGNYAYVSAYWAGVRIIDISDPMNPWEVGFYQSEDFRAYELAASGNYVYVEDRDYNMRIIDVSDPQNPSEVGKFVTDVLDISDIAVSGHVVFVGSYVRGMMVIDVSNPANPVKRDEFPAFYIRAIAVKENYIYELARGSGLVVYEYRRQ